MSVASGIVARTGASRRFGWPGAQLGVGGALVLLTLVVTLLHEFLAAYDPLAGDILVRLKPVSTPGHPLGTDQLGRDILSRLLFGFPWSLGIALFATLVAMIVGTFTGLWAAWTPGWVRTIVNRSADTIIAFPGLVIAICVIAVIGRGFWPLALTLGILTWPFFARVIFAEALGLLQREYVLAAELFGVPGWRILLRHVLPGLRPTLMVMLAFHFADMLIAESALSFLGLGAPIQAPTWGNMLAESRQYLFQAPWMMLVPGGAIVLVVVMLNLVGDGIAKMSRDKARAVE